MPATPLPASTPPEAQPPAARAPWSYGARFTAEERECIFRFTFLAGGCIGTLFGYGVFFQKTLDDTYGSKTFDIQLLLIFVGRLFTGVFAFCTAMLIDEVKRPAIRVWRYQVIIIGTTMMSNFTWVALDHLSFPLQMMMKSFKMVPVMLWSIMLLSKRYAITDWLIAAVVTGGMVEVLCTGPDSYSADDHDTDYDATTAPLGVVFACVALHWEGFVPTWQEKLFKQYTILGKFALMLNVSFLGCVVNLLFLCIIGDIVDVPYFFQYPLFCWNVFWVGVFAAASQYFIYTMVKEYGALVLAATMNVRQLLSLIGSYMAYRHHIAGLQVLGFIMVFGALYYMFYLILQARREEEQDRMWQTGRDSGDAADGPPEKDMDNKPVVEDPGWTDMLWAWVYGEEKSSRQSDRVFYSGRSSA
jgi:drug/metabolite transporter (DMT)-like permease